MQTPSVYIIWGIVLLDIPLDKLVSAIPLLYNVCLPHNDFLLFIDIRRQSYVESTTAAVGAHGHRLFYSRVVGNWPL